MQRYTNFPKYASFFCRIVIFVFQNLSICFPPPSIRKAIF